MTRADEQTAPNVVSQEEAAVATGTSVARVQRLRRTGAVSTYRAGTSRRVLVDLDEVRAALAPRRVMPAPTNP